jgi:hypothetical protein
LLAINCLNATLPISSSRRKWAVERGFWDWQSGSGIQDQFADLIPAYVQTAKRGDDVALLICWPEWRMAALALLSIAMIGSLHWLIS